MASSCDDCTLGIRRGFLNCFTLHEICKQREHIQERFGERDWLDTIACTWLLRLLHYGSDQPRNTKKRCASYYACKYYMGRIIPLLVVLLLLLLFHRLHLLARSTYRQQLLTSHPRLQEHVNISVLWESNNPETHNQFKLKLSSIHPEPVGYIDWHTKSCQTNLHIKDMQ